jgi:putative ABC transport system substrate-binding protein
VIDRRAFLEGAALAVLSAPLAAEARTTGAGRVPRVGVLGEVNPVAWTVKTSAAEIECRWAGDRPDRLPALAAELVEHGVDVLVTAGVPATRAAMQATAAVPVVFVAGGDPVREGLVRSAPAPGGNVTGLSVPSEGEMAARRLGALAQAAPGMKRVAVLCGADASSSESILRHLVERFAIAVEPLGAGSVEEIERAFDAMTAGRVGGVLVLPDALFAMHARRLVHLAAQRGLPAAYGARSFVSAGGLMAVHGDLAEVIRRATALVTRVLGGAAPATLPVESAAHPELAVNLTTARALGLRMPDSLVAGARVVIGA